VQCSVVKLLTTAPHRDSGPPPHCLLGSSNSGTVRGRSGWRLIAATPVRQDAVLLDRIGQLDIPQTLVDVLGKTR